MRGAILTLIGLLVCSCRSYYEFGPGPEAPEVEVRVRRIAPEEEVYVLGHPGYTYADFVVLEPKEYEGLQFRLRFMAWSTGALFEAREFRLRLLENLIFGKNRELQNPNGTVKVWGDTWEHWNFEEMTLEVFDSENEQP